jgi:hypothetical protein
MKSFGPVRVIGFTGDNLPRELAVEFLESYEPVTLVPIADQVIWEVGSACRVTGKTIAEEPGLYGPIVDWWRTVFKPATEGDDYWVRGVRKRIEAALKKERPVVVPDVQAVPEAEMIRALGGEIWRVRQAPSWADRLWGAMRGPCPRGPSQAIEADTTVLYEGDPGALFAKITRLAASLNLARVWQAANHPTPHGPTPSENRDRGAAH